MMHRFKIIVPSFNCLDYIGRSLRSIEDQTFKDYDVCVVDDCSTIQGQREIILDYCNRNGWKYIFNAKNEGALFNIVQSIRYLECQDDDVIAILDGDDWFSHSAALEHLYQVYTDHDVYITWGQCEIYPEGKTAMKYAQPVPDMVVDQKLYRDIPFVFWHLNAFKYYLWKHIEDADLRDADGRYLQLMYDKAILFPMLEMAGKKLKFVAETNYVYNIANPLNDYANTPPEEHKRVDVLIRSKKRYETLDLLRN
jgi:glycosyltransferase involved in cell wall biosynthesis